MNLSILIVNFYSSAFLNTCLESIQQNVKKGTLEIIVVNNSVGDTGFPALIERFPQARFLNNGHNVGFAKACNQAARLANGDHFLFLNPDIVLTPNTIELMSEYLANHPEAGAIGPKVLNTDGSLQFSCRGFPTFWTGLFNRYSLLTKWFPENPYSRQYLMLDYDHAYLKEVDWISGCCLMIDRKVFFDIGQFDENYFLFNEDVDLCKTLKKSGYKIVYFPEGQVTHHIGSSDKSLNPATTIKRHLGMSYYFRKHHNSPFLISAFVDLMIGLRCLAQLGYSLFR